MKIIFYKFRHNWVNKKDDWDETMDAVDDKMDVKEFFENQEKSILFFYRKMYCLPEYVGIEFEEIEPKIELVKQRIENIQMCKDEFTAQLYNYHEECKFLTEYLKK